MSTIPVLTAVRIIPRESDFLDRKSGSRGEIFFDRDANTLRIFDGNNQGGIGLARADLANVTNSVFAAKATAAGVGSGGGGGNTTVSVGTSLPSSPSNGNLWLNTNNGSLYVYINDGDSNQWIQPAFATPNLTDYATKIYVDNAVSNGRFEIYVAADDSTQRRVSTGNLVQFIGAGGVTTSTDADGNVTITGGGTTGNVTFSTTTIDTTDSSAITFTPAVIFNSDVTVENELTVRVSLNAEQANIKNLTSDNGTFDFGQLVINGFANEISSKEFNTFNLSAGEDLQLSTNNYTYTWYFKTDGGTELPGSLFVSTIDTADSSAITITPAAIFNSDITVENEIVAKKIVNSNDITFSTPAIVFDGLSTFYKSTEVFTGINGATGTVTHNFEVGSLFFHSNLVANFTANFINVPTTDSRSISVALILDQGATPYIPNAIEINSSSETIKWSGGSPPSGTANYTDIVNFTLIRSSGAWTVLGSLSTYN